MRVPGHKVVDKIDAIGEGVLGWKIGQRVGVGFLSITPCEPLRPAPANLKDDLVLRPIFHQLERRIEAHIFIAFMAYWLQVTLRALPGLRPLAAELSSCAVLDNFAAIQMLDVHFRRPMVAT
jgi:hypothetical protein